MTAAEIQDNRRVVDLLRRGDEACFDALFRRYYKPLCAYASRFVAVDRAEELVQDTLMWVWESRDKLLPEMPLKSLLFTIVKNKSLNSVARDTIRSKIIRQLAEQYEEPNSTTRISTSKTNWPSRLAAASEKNAARISGDIPDAPSRRNDPQGDSRPRWAYRPQTVNYRIGQTVQNCSARS